MISSLSLTDGFIQETETGDGTADIYTGGLKSRLLRVRASCRGSFMAALSSQFLVLVSIRESMRPETGVMVHL